MENEPSKVSEQGNEEWFSKTCKLKKTTSVLNSFLSLTCTQINKESIIMMAARKKDARYRAALRLT